MILNNFTAYVGPQKRWIEIRPLYTFVKGRWPELSGEYIIYSNERRTPIGELQQEANQDNSILGSFVYTPETTIGEFKGKDNLNGDELIAIAYLIKSTIAYHYARCLGIKVNDEAMVGAI